MTTKDQITIAPAPGATEAARLQELYDAAQNGMRRVIALGLYCFEIKSKLKHGEFYPWLAEHLPDVSARTIRAYTQLTRDTLEAAGFQIRSALRISLGGEILTLPTDEVTGESAALRDKICAIVDGKTQRQLMLEFKTVNEDEDGNLYAVTGAGKRHPRRPVDPAADAARERAEADAALDDAAGELRRIAGDKRTLAFSSKGARTRFLRASQTLNSMIVDMQKGR